MSRVPVHIITGFLGAGKTMFLNHFIQDRLPDRIFVIENECGATNVDGALVMPAPTYTVQIAAVAPFFPRNNSLDQITWGI